MLKACVKSVDRLWKSLVQVSVLCTSSTAGKTLKVAAVGFYPAANTGFAQSCVSFTQPYPAILNLLRYKFYPLSTGPMNTTNLIKDLYS